TIKQFVPESVLAARARRLQMPQVTNGTSTHTSKLEWLRKGAANCYLNLHVPAVTRRLRDQNQLSIPSARRWPRVSRRQEPSARILTYHRVNDEHDPFFPAISTNLFEQEMRFLARHYRVVPLREILKHLEGGSSQPVMAITFDDGYQDNYHNALPI